MEKGYFFGTAWQFADTRIIGFHGGSLGIGMGITVLGGIAQGKSDSNEVIRTCSTQQFLNKSFMDFVFPDSVAQSADYGPCVHILKQQNTEGRDNTKNKTAPGAAENKNEQF